jgi:hypothetical protein
VEQIETNCTADALRVGISNQVTVKSLYPYYKEYPARKYYEQFKRRDRVYCGRLVYVLLCRKQAHLYIS